MAYLLDTSILARLANAADQKHSIATNAVVELHRLGETLHLTPQVLIEFRNVATRPIPVNGLGLSITDTEVLASTFESRFPLLDDAPGIYPEWKSIVGALGVIGKQVHDARLAAVCHVHRVSHFLTFNVAHFTRLAVQSPGFTVVDPASV